MRKDFVKFSAIALALVALGTSCTEEEKPAEPSIVGKWEINKEIFTISDSSTNVVLFGDTTVYGPGELMIEFQANNMYVNTITMGTDVKSNSGYYSVTNKVLKLSDTPDMADADEFNIATLTATEVKITNINFNQGTKFYSELTGKRK
ncbi:MAG: hypothetical protein NBV77_07100 [Bacteroidia bacterium]|nr:hypothetical protein [Bacteroidia bacterium]